MIRTLNSCNCDDLVTIIDDAIVMEGQKGESAYETAVRLGYQGTEAEWVDSLHGKGITLGHGDPTSQLTAREARRVPPARRARTATPSPAVPAHRQPAPPARPETCTSNPTVTSTSSNKGRL